MAQRDASLAPASEQNLGSETASLFAGAFGQVGSADASGEAQVVFDFRTGSCLSPDGITFDQSRGEALGCGIDRSAQSCWPRAVDSYVVLGARRITEPS